MQGRWATRETTHAVKTLSLHRNISGGLLFRKMSLHRSSSQKRKRKKEKKKKKKEKKRTFTETAEAVRCSGLL